MNPRTPKPKNQVIKCLSEPLTISKRLEIIASYRASFPRKEDPRTCKVDQEALRRSKAKALRACRHWQTAPARAQDLLYTRIRLPFHSREARLSEWAYSSSQSKK